MKLKNWLKITMGSNCQKILSLKTTFSKKNANMMQLTLKWENCIQSRAVNIFNIFKKYGNDVRLKYITFQNSGKKNDSSQAVLCNRCLEGLALFYSFPFSSLLTPSSVLFSIYLLSTSFYSFTRLSILCTISFPNPVFYPLPFSKVSYFFKLLSLAFLESLLSLFSLFPFV